MKTRKYVLRRWVIPCVTLGLAAGAVVPVGASSSVIDAPEVTWFARLLGHIGLPMLLVIAGVLLGIITGAIVILIVHLRDKRSVAAPVNGGDRSVDGKAESLAQDSHSP